MMRAKEVLEVAAKMLEIRRTEWIKRILKNIC